MWICWAFPPTGHQISPLVTVVPSLTETRLVNSPSRAVGDSRGKKRRSAHNVWRAGAMRYEYSSRAQVNVQLYMLLSGPLARVLRQSSRKPPITFTQTCLCPRVRSFTLQGCLVFAFPVNSTLFYSTPQISPQINIGMCHY